MYATSSTIKRYANKTYYLHESFFLSVFKSFIKQFSGVLENDLLNWYIKKHRESIIDCLELKMDCIALLKTLKTAEIYASIVSNIDQDMLEPLVTRDKLNLYLDHWTSSEKVKSCKPDKEIFRCAMELAHLKSEEVLFVGDSPEHDITGASRMGMITALIVNGGMPPPLQTGAAKIEPDFTINSLTEIKKIVNL